MKNKGFTLIEFLCVFLIISIVASLYIGAISKFANYRQKRKLTGIISLKNAQIDILSRDDNGTFHQNNVINELQQYVLTNKIGR